MKFCFIALNISVFGKVRELVGETKYAFAKPQLRINYPKLQRPIRMRGIVIVIVKY